MFSISKILVVLAVVLSVLVGAAAGFAQNLVVNPGFEEVQGGEPVGWVPYGGGAINLDSQVFHSGQYSLHVMGNTLQTMVPVNPNTGYRLSAWAKRDEEGLTGLWVGDSNIQPIAFTHNGSVGMGGWSTPFNWTQYELAFRTGDLVLLNWSDGFESGNFTTGGWTNSGCDIQSTYKYSGTYAARFNSSDSLTKSYSTSGKINIRVQYARYTSQCESNDHFISEWYNGSAWTTMEDLTGNSAWAVKDYSLPSGAGNNANFKIRFRTSHNGSTDYAYVDDVKIIDQNSISVVLSVNGGATVTAWFDDVMLVEDNTVQVGDVTPQYPPLDVTEDEITKGYLIFSRNILSKPYYTSVPTRDEVTLMSTDGVDRKAALGEYESALFMVRSLRGLTGVSLSITPPTLQGTQIGVDTRVFHNSIREFSSISYEQVPLFLPPASTEDLATDTTRAYWLTFHVPEDAQPGTYTGTATLSATNAPSTDVELTVVVRPMRVLPTPIAYGMYHDMSLLPVDPLYRTTDYQRLCYQDMKAHEMTSVTEYNRPTIVGEELRFDVPYDESRMSINDEMAMLIGEGLGGENRNIPLLYMGPFVGAPGTPQQLKAHQYGMGWPEILFYVCDEPGTYEPCGGYLQEYIGLPDTRTVTAGLNVELLGSLYSVWILGTGMDVAAMKAEADTLGKELWAYDCQLHGATPQHDRYLSGLYTWAWDTKGLYQWVYTQYPDKYVTPEGEWLGTDYWSYGYVVAGPDGPIPTHGWEGRREGIDDYRYLYTLETLAAYGLTSANQATVAIAQAAQAFLNGVRSMVQPGAYTGRPPCITTFTNDFIPQPEITPADYDSIRETAAGWIEQLSPTAGLTWDVSADYSATSNPSGQWTFLLYAGDYPNAAYTTNTAIWPIYVGDTGSLQMWYHWSLASLPVIFKNAGTTSMVTDPGGETILDPGQVGLHPRADGQGYYPSAARWTAPATGEYVVEAVFSGRHISGATTDVKVVKNGATVIWSAQVDGWSGGYYWFYTPATFGTAPVRTYSATLTLLVGEYLDFVVGAGVTQSADSTGLSVTVVPIGPAP